VSISCSKKDVQRAGEALISDDLRKTDPELFKQSMGVLSYWRANHVHSLDHVTNLLKEKSLKVDRKSIVVKRLKRAPSIIEKLKRFDTMKLRNMQDIAGCRSILSSTKNVHKVKRELNKKREYKVRDYIKRPKPDGYRGVHLVGKFKNKENGNQYPVEMQLRSRVQHSWATAVEIIDLFTNQALKSNEGKQDWLDFFKFISHEFSKLEHINNPPIEGSLTESMRLAKKLGVYKKFKGYAGSLQLIESHVKREIEGYNLVQIDFTNQTVKVTTFPFEQFEIASKEYLKYEKKAAENIRSVVALVSSQSIGNLKEAYPNYFADSELFVYNLKQVEKKYVPEQKNILTKWLARTGA
jgi:ppGpp synthetase/RelA/SpoT-type nucleotidyltranferase